MFRYSIQKMLIAVLIFEIFSIESANSQLKIDFEFRPRFEFRDGYRSIQAKNSSPSFIISQRSRLSVFYDTKKLKLKFTPQDVRVWGDETNSSSTGVYGDAASLELYEAYADFKLNEIANFVIGRQEFAYDYERLLAKRNWNQNGLSYDAVLLKSKLKNFNVHLASSWNSLSETTSDNLYFPNRIKSLNFLWINKKFKEKFNVSFLHIASGVTRTDSTNKIYFRQTTGVYSDFKNDNIKYRANFYYQYGKNNKGTNVNAFLADAEFSLIFKKSIIGIGGSYLSGNKNINSKTDNLFDVLYGARHRYFGHMDYFRNIPSHTNSGGLVDIYGFISYKLSEKLSIKNTGHYFRLAEKNQLTLAEKNLGYENEIEFSYKVNNEIKIKTAYLFYIPTATLKDIQGVTDSKFNQFVFVEIDVNVILFRNDL